MENCSFKNKKDPWRIARRRWGHLIGIEFDPLSENVKPHPQKSNTSVGRNENVVLMALFLIVKRSKP
jgi:hypothetical protein